MNIIKEVIKRKEKKSKCGISQRKVSITIPPETRNSFFIHLMKDMHIYTFHSQIFVSNFERLLHSEWVHRCVNSWKQHRLVKRQCHNVSFYNTSPFLFRKKSAKWQGRSCLRHRTMTPVTMTHLSKRNKIDDSSHSLL